MQTKLHPVVLKILQKRGMSNQDITEFLSWNLNDLPDLTTLNDSEKAANRIISAIESKETIIIYGDYDVDGTTSCALFYHFFKMHNITVELLQPSRFNEGYGLHKSSIDEAKLIISYIIDMPERDKIYEGEVVKTESFGAFVKFMGGYKEGLVHISNLDSGRVRSTEDVCKVGDKVKIKFMGAERGKIQLSMKGIEGNPTASDEAVMKGAAPDSRGPRNDRYKRNDHRDNRDRRPRGNRDNNHHNDHNKS